MIKKMKKLSFNRWLCILGICAIAVLIVIIVAGNGYTGEDARNELLKLDVSTSMDDLKEKGYIDVSQIMDSPDDKIVSFLNKAHNRERGVLRIVNIIDGKLCAKILIYDHDLDAIRMWTSYPNTQQDEAPGKCFTTEVCETNDAGVVTVILKNIPDISDPYPQVIVDEKLYSYLAG